MAFDRDGLARMGSANTNAPAMWSYTTTDAIATVNTSGYFDSASAELAVNDYIFCVTSTGTTAVHSHVIVLTNASGVVDVSNGVTIAVTDSD